MHLPAGLARIAVPLLAGTLLVAATLVPTGAVASASAPVPTPRAFGAVADDFPHWERENTCSPTQKPGAKKLRGLLRRTYGRSISSSTVRPCTSADSGHEEGRAVDWMTNRNVPAQKAMANSFLAWLQATDSYGNTYAMARRLGIQYVIWNNRMWRAYDPGRGWAEYDNCLHKKKKHDSAYANACHRTHVHLSLSWDGAYKRTSYFSGYVVCPTFYPQSAAPPAAPRGALVTLPQPPVRILNTQSGNGMPNGPCRVRGGSPVDLSVLGRGGVPSDGVAAVVLRVALVSPTYHTWLRVWPAGAPMPTAWVASANPGTPTADVTVNVGTNGMVSLRHSLGMSHFTAYAVGYYPVAEG
jgi:hypothetical protein